jgi:hypothetical protein
MPHLTNRRVRGERDVGWAGSGGAGRCRLALTTSMGKDEQVLCDTIWNARVLAPKRAPDSSGLIDLRSGLASVILSGCLMGVSDQQPNTERWSQTRTTLVRQLPTTLRYNPERR